MSVSKSQFNLNKNKSATKSNIEDSTKPLSSSKTLFVLSKNFINKLNEDCEKNSSSSKS